MDDVNTKLDKILDKQTEVEVRLGKIETSLVEHMRRTSLLESAVEFLKKHVHMAQGAIALVVIIIGWYIKFK